MFFAEEDLTLHITRGDAGEITVRAVDETTDGGETPYIFKAGEVLRLKIYEKKNCSVVVLQKDYPVVKDTETVTLALTEADTKIGEIISKPVDYWYEIELNPFTEPQTIVGYDDDGAKILRLYPEGLDKEYIPPTEEELGTVDKNLSLTSDRAIQNQAVARAVVQIESTVEKNNEATTKALTETTEKISILNAKVTNLSTIPEGSTTGDAELIDIRLGANGNKYASAGESIRNQFKDIVEVVGCGKNLFNPNDIDFVDGVRFDENGDLIPSAQHMTTGFIEVEPNNKYYLQFKQNGTTRYTLRSAVAYDENKNIVTIIPTETGIGSGFLIDNEAIKYIRISLFSTNYANAPATDVQIEKGSRTDYEPFQQFYKLTKNTSFDIPRETEAEGIIEFQNWDKPVFDKAPLFTLENDLTGYSANNGDIRVTSVLAKYDALATANPDYITKSNFGADSEGNMLYRYDFVEPEQPHSNKPYSTKKPKVILISGVHPEYGGIYCLYHTMNEITNNPALIDLRRNCHFIVVPIVNHYGCTNYVRKNANGVDLARNFEVDFVKMTNTESNEYGGTAPLTELECQYIDNLLAENTDAICMASCHSFKGDGSEDNIQTWGASATLYETNLTMKVIDKLSRVWKSKYDIIPDDVKYLGETSLDAPGGSEGKQAMKYGIQGLTLEVCEFFRYETNAVRYSPMAISRGTEVYINWLLTNLWNYENDDKSLGNIENVLDSIIALQNTYIGGETE